MTGNQDYLLRVVIAGLPEFEKFMVGGLTKIWELHPKSLHFYTCALKPL